MPLPIQKLIAKNCVVADSEFNNNSGVILTLLLFFLGVYIIQLRCIGKPFHGFLYFERCYVIVCLKCYVEYLPFDTFVRTCNENCNEIWM
jgi:hypothetical protein